RRPHLSGAEEGGRRSLCRAGGMAQACPASRGFVVARVGELSRRAFRRARSATVAWRIPAEGCLARGCTRRVRAAALVLQVRPRWGKRRGGRGGGIQDRPLEPANIETLLEQRHVARCVRCIASARCDTL